VLVIADRRRHNHRDYPMITPAEALEHLADLQFDERTTALFLTGNTQRVFTL